MPKGKPNKQYTGEFKQKAVVDMRKNMLSQCEVAEKYGISRYIIQRWERIYLEEGPEGLYINRRGRGSIGRPPRLGKKTEEDLVAENQRLRAENDYLKKLNALVIEEERRNKRRNFPARSAAHRKGAYPAHQYDIWPIAAGLTLAQSRALEQTLITAYTFDTLNNILNSIAPSKWGKLANEFAQMQSLLKSYTDPE